MAKPAPALARRPRHSAIPVQPPLVLDNVRLVSLVTKSLVELPVSSAMAVIATATVGAVVSIVTAWLAVLPTLPVGVDDPHLIGEAGAGQANRAAMDGRNGQMLPSPGKSSKKLRRYLDLDLCCRAELEFGLG